MISRLIRRFFADRIIKTPYMADSITQGTLAAWEKKVGDHVKQDETVANIETDKVTIPVNAPESGIIKEQFAKEGDTVQVGSDLFKLEPKAIEKGTGASTLNVKEDKPSFTHESKTSSDIPSLQKKSSGTFTPSSSQIGSTPSPIIVSSIAGSRSELPESMSKMRLRIAERMKQSQQINAALTTFNEIDMSFVVQMRNKYKDAFSKKNEGLKLGFMGPFVKACTRALWEWPMVNARMDIDKKEIIYYDYVDISIAVATPKGLVTPVLRDCHKMSMTKVEKDIWELGEKARDNKLSIEDMTGGTFTISNGGVFGSMMGTPIINIPQSAILGMHAIKDRPVVVDGQIVIRPMMYVALTYDHRLIDGREAVNFLIRVKELVEDPVRLLLEI